MQRQATTTHPRRFRWGRGLIALATVVLLAASVGCSSSGDGASSTKATTTTASTSSTSATDAPQPTSLDLTLTAKGVDGLPDQVPAGLVQVAVDDQTPDGGAGSEVNFTLVDDGTKIDDFVAGIAPVLAGGPMPAFVQTTSGAKDDSTIALTQGTYLVWINKANNLDRDTTADDVVATPLTVGPGDDSATVPDADGTVKATDYHFDVDIPAGKATVKFENGSTEQFHHVILVDFGTNDPAVVREKMPEILASNDGSVPDGIDADQIRFGIASSGVFGPGKSGTFHTDLVEGHTYGAVCFVSDVSGGAPHAIQHHMFAVFAL